MFFNPAKRFTRVTAFVIVMFVMMTLFMPQTTSYADTFGDYTYSENANGITITKYTGSATDVKIPKSINDKPVTKIEDSAFLSSKIEAVEIPSSVTYIGFWSFSTSSLKSVKFMNPNKLPEIQLDSFSDGQSIVFYCHPSLKDELKSINFLAFMWGVWTIEEFDPSTTEPEPEPTETVTTDKAFNFELNSDESGYIITKYVGKGCTNVTIPAIYKDKPVQEIGRSAFNGAYEIVTMSIPDSVSVIGNEAFAYCGRMTSIDLPANLKSIGNYAFRSCSSMVEFNIPASVEKIGEEAFIFSRKLKDIKVNENNNNFKDIDGVLFSKDGKDLIYYANVGRTATHYDIPEGTERIMDDAFKVGYDDKYYSVLETVTYPNSLKEIGSRAFQYASLTEVTISGDVKMGTNVYLSCDNLKKVTVAEGVKTITQGMLSGLTSLEELNLPSTLKTIEDRAMWNLPLKTIDLPEGLEKIGSEVFEYSKIISLQIPSSVKELGSHAFYAMFDLKDVTFAPNSQLNELSAYCFNNTNIENIVLPDNIKTISTGALGSCWYLKSIDIPDSVTTLGNRVFAASSMTKVVFPEGVKEIGDYTFENSTFSENRGINNVSFPKSLEKLGVGTFKSAENLTDVKFPEGIKIKSIPTYTFYDCYSLRKLQLPASIEGTDIGAFFRYDTIIDKRETTIEYKAPAFKRHPLDCSGLIISDDDYDLKEDGMYYVNKNIQIPGGTIYAGHKLETQDCFKFRYTGSEIVNAHVKSVDVPENIVFNDGDTQGKVEVTILAEGVQAGDKVEIRAIGKKYKNIVYAEGVLALAKGHDMGTFASIKNITFNTDELRGDEYEIYASVNRRDWTRGNNAVTVNKPEPRYFTISSTASDGGKISTVDGYDGVYDEGDNATYQYEPDEGYKVSSLVVNGQNVDFNENGGIYEFKNIQQDHFIKVTFATTTTETNPPVQNTDTFKITSIASENGIITESASFKAGSGATYFYLPNDGYRVSALFVDGNEVPYIESGGIYTFTNIQGNHTIKVEFEAIKAPEPESTTYSITSTASNGGKITASGSYKEGTDATYFYTPNKGYKVTALFVNGKSVPHKASGGSYIFTNLQANQNISVFFEPEKTVLGEKAKPKKSAPKSFKIKALKKKARLSWKKSKGADKYQVAYKQKISKKWKYKTVSAKKRNLIIKKLKSNKKYQFKIRSYELNGNKKIYSKWSKARTVKIKK